MDLLITLATRNRKASKALGRIGMHVQRLEELFRGTQVEDERFDLIIICFVDQEESYFHLVPNKERTYHVQRGMPNGLTFQPDSDLEFLRAIGRTVHHALLVSDMDESAQAPLERNVAEWHANLPSAG